MSKHLKDQDWLLVFNSSKTKIKILGGERQVIDDFRKCGVNISLPDNYQNKTSYEILYNSIEKGYRHFVILGGDGTFNRCVDVIFKQKKVSPSEITIAAFPFGTGNDWVRTILSPGSIKELSELIYQEKVFLHDVGKVTYQENNQTHNHFFVNIAGMAYDAYVTYNANISIAKGTIGKLTYLMQLFRCLFSYKKTNVTVIVDEEVISGRIFSLNVGICKYNGNGMMQVPNGIPDDGLFDVTIFGDMSTWEVILNTPHLYTGKFVKLSKVKILRGKKVRVESDSPIGLETDGESLGSDPFEFTIQQRVLRVISPLIQSTN